MVTAGSVAVASIHHYEHGSTRLDGAQRVVSRGTITLPVHDRAERVHRQDLGSLLLASADIPIAAHLADRLMSR
ncbi:MAG: hypothetical protein ACLQBD_25495 [Syntrophobacteraceae bacterium]